MNQDSPAGGPEQGPAPAGAPSASGLSRRRLLRAGASAAPVIMTLASGPVSAGTTGCVVASSFVSVTTFKSRNPGATSVSCGTLKCEDWQRLSNDMELSGKGCNTKALNVSVSKLLGSPSGSSTYSGQMLYVVMGQTIYRSGPLGVLQHLVALTLDITTGNSSAPNGISHKKLKDLWSSYSASGTFSVPGAGLTWDEAHIMAWLRSMLGYTIP